MRRLTRMLLLLTSLDGAAEISPGLYFDPDHDGHGFDLQAVGEQWVMVFYSYDADGMPLWYLGVLAEQDDGTLEGTIELFDYASAREPPQQATPNNGPVTLDFAAGCAGAVNAARFDWELEGEQGSWCVRALLPQGGDRSADFTGLWFAGQADVGWGLSMDFHLPAAPGDKGSGTEAAIIFYYDAEGRARWALGSSDAPGASANVELYNFIGYCRSCTPAPLQFFPAGELSHELSVIDGRPGGFIDMSLSYALQPFGNWSRSGAIVPLSDPARGLIPLPAKVDNDRPLMITDVTVVPMEGEQDLLPHRTVVIRGGLIDSMGLNGQLAVPADAVRVDGRDLYLGPGLSEMHLRISFGGQLPAEEAGLLMIANGVTTALNMGDGRSVDVPDLARRFESGELIGPTFYAGQVAYGPSDNASAPLTVRSPQQANDYANNIAAAGYDYIKVYWGITRGMMDRFSQESRRLGMPIIGHIPRGQSSRESFLDGFLMAAHVQEPWMSFLQSSFNDLSLPAAAAEFLEFGVYLTPTLAVFESYTTVYGGNAPLFNELSTREGYTYTSPLVRNGWRNYFDSTNIQGNGQVIGGLDQMYQFFLRLTKAFYDAGVPLLVGTDAPGFPGVMSGFGAIRELELFEQAGLPPEAIYAAASVNAGRFVAETLGEAPFGTVRVGNRADLILTSANPRTAVENLRRPLAVIARGRLWSQEFLQAELDLLASRYGFGKSAVHPLISDFDPGLPFCASHIGPPNVVLRPKQN